MSTQRFGCGVGAAVAQETHERATDAELLFRLARGLQAAADAAALLALRAERDDARETTHRAAFFFQEIRLINGQQKSCFQSATATENRFNSRSTA